MRSSGFSLIEMVVTIAIAAILATVGTLYFQQYQKGYRMDAQTRLLFSELQSARAQAIYQRKGTRVKLFADRFEVYSSQQDGPSVRPVATHPLSYPITSPTTPGFDITVGGDVDFDERGVTYDLRSICLQPSAGHGGVDSVVIHYARISIGRKDHGDACVTDNITLK
ncbi:prepilin-type N-terminal cleavage/methylation domain-containing protein [Geomonas subterranea]|uniref:prepilin-type N-terminal cleavage/methylation domain-containing protein n=1 Tax=Geomonas subterranea TaxID=2847989 RepID=UPI001CD570E7|nr:prepilin-type N-terminal cleavage/methylation domain-containing protein [Geomonas fuzhouensis]